MKLKNIVAATVIALSNQIVGAEECKTAEVVGGGGGALTGAIAGGQGGLAAAGGLGFVCGGSILAAPFTGGTSLLIALAPCGGTLAALTGGATVGAVAGYLGGEWLGRKAAEVAGKDCKPKISTQTTPVQQIAK